MSLLENTSFVVGLVSGTLSLLSMFAPLKTWKKRLTLGAYVLLVGLLVSLATYQSSQLARANDVARVADKMIDERKMRYTHRAFVLASLSFLEKNKDLYPDTYKRAQKLCEAFKCDDPSSSMEMIELSYTMAGIVRGLGTMNTSFRD